MLGGKNQYGQPPLCLDLTPRPASRLTYKELRRNAGNERTRNAGNATLPIILHMQSTNSKTIRYTHLEVRKAAGAILTKNEAKITTISSTQGMTEKIILEQAGGHIETQYSRFQSDKRDAGLPAVSKALKLEQMKNRKTIVKSLRYR